MDQSTVATAGANASAVEYNALRVDSQLGWRVPTILVGSVYQDDSWAYASVSGQIGTVTVTTDATTRYEVGQKVRFKQGAGYKYFIITSVSATSISITGGSEYTLTNAAITDLYISNWISPLDWPMTMQSILLTLTDAASIDLDLNASKSFQITLGGNRTLTISNAKKGDRFILRLVQDGTGSRLISTWFSTISWSGGGNEPILSTAAGDIDVFGFLCTGSGTYDGFIIGQEI